MTPTKPIPGGHPSGALAIELATDPRWIAQAKIDGRRAQWDGSVLRLSSGRVTEPPPALRSIGLPLDGELSQGVFWVFDAMVYDLQLRHRLTTLRELPLGDGVRLVTTAPALTAAHAEAEGWEGVVYKRLASAYPRRGRKTTPDWIKFRLSWA